MSGRVLLLVPTTTYRAEPFLAAARRMGIDVVVGSNRCHVLAEHWPSDGSLLLRFDEPDAAARAILESSRERPFDAILAVDDQATEIAALAAQALELPHNSPAAARTARNKRAMREALASAGVPAPRHLAFPLATDPVEAGAELRAAFGFPCVVKPLLLTGSRGVIRADDEIELARAWRRVQAILRAPELAREAELDPAFAEILVEEFVPGVEVALEGLLARGRLQVIALIDKPEPLDGPFFEETIYVTPSRLPKADQDAIAEVTGRAARAIGLEQGPVHAEIRLHAAGPRIIEVAGRSIGGLCSQALRFDLGISLEEVILRQALQADYVPPERTGEASGVMMIPIPRSGVLREASGIAEAEAVPGVTGVTITIRPGEQIVPLPEGSAYLGFIFAQSSTPAAVETALRQAQSCLRFAISPTLPVVP
jgi:biotin carboxylase